MTEREDDLLCLADYIMLFSLFRGRQQPGLFSFEADNLPPKKKSRNKDLCGKMLSSASAFEAQEITSNLLWGTNLAPFEAKRHCAKRVSREKTLADFPALF